MRKVTYSQDVDALLIELSDELIDHAEEAGQVIIHVSPSGAPVLLEILDARAFLLGSLTSVMKGAETALP